MRKGNRLVESFTSAFSQPWAVALVLVILSIWYFVGKSNDGRKRRQRRMSFTSQSMVMGIFPKKIQYPDCIIHGSIFFHDCPSKEAIAEFMVKPMLQYKRLSSIPDLHSSTMTRPCPPFAPMDLIRKITISGSDEATYEAIFQRLHDPLREGRNDLPWWEILLIENDGAGQSAVVLRIHHSLGDGVSLVHVFEQMVTYQDGTSFKSMMTFSRQIDESNGDLLEKVPSSSLLRKALSFVNETFRVITLDKTPYDDGIAFVTSNHGNHIYTNNRSYVIFPTVDLKFIKQLKSAANVTVNDILMATVSQAIHDYCREQGCPVLESKQKKLQCRALLPVALPRSSAEFDDSAQALRNAFAMVSTDMGVGCVDIMERLQHIHETTQEMKANPRAFMQLMIQNNVVPLLPLSMGQQTCYDIFTRHSLVFSNVPGPDKPCLLAGKVATGVQMFYANLIPQIGLISYAGKVYGNMVLDTDVLADAQSLARLYAQALLELADRLKVDAPYELKTAAQKRGK